MIFKDYKLYFTLKTYKHLFCTTVSAGAREVGPYKLKNTVQGANTGRQFNKQNIDKYKYRYTTLQQQDTAVVLSGKTVHK